MTNFDQPGANPECTDTMDPSRREMLQATLKSVIAWSLMSENLDQLAEKIACVPIYSSTSGASAWEIVNKFLSEYPRYREADSLNTRKFLETFLGFCLKNVDVNELAAWLQPLRKSDLLTDSLDLVHSDTWTPPGANDHEWSNYRICLLRIRANMLRRDQQFADAEDECLRLRDSWLGQEQKDWKELSIIEYELGYIDFLAGRYDDADAHYDLSVRYAEKAGDEVGGLISGQTRIHARYHGRKSQAQQTCQQFVENIAALHRVSQGQSRAENWVWNGLVHLFELNLEMGKIDEAKRLLTEEVLPHPKFVRSATDPRHELLETKYNAMLSVAEGKYAAALDLYAKYLELNQIIKGSSTVKPPLPELIEVTTKEQEMAREYRDAGVALRQMGLTADAHMVWKRGLAEPDNLGNRLFKDDIRQLLNED